MSIDTTLGALVAEEPFLGNVAKIVVIQLPFPSSGLNQSATYNDRAI